MANIKRGILGAIVFGLLLTVFAPLALSNVVSPNGAYGGGGGATATPSPVPTPLLITAVATLAPGSNPTPAIPVGVQAGDCVVISAEVNSQQASGGVIFSPPAATNTNNNDLWTHVWSGFAFFTPNSQFGYASTRYISPSDIAIGHLTLNGFATNNAVCMAYFRHVTCSGFDSVSTNNNNSNTASTHPQPNSITTTKDGDLILSVGVLNGSTGDTYAAGTGATNAAYQPPVTGTADGCWADYTIQTTAGAFQPGTATLNNSRNWGAMQFALQNINGTK